MEHQYHITGMTCSSCEAKVKSALLLVDHVIAVEVNGVNKTATITMDSHVPIHSLQKALGDKYTIAADNFNEHLQATKSWFSIYWPVILIFLYISIIPLVVVLNQDQGNYLSWMNYFMAGFFLVFSFFKLLNITSFATAYAMYDIIAKKIPAWGYLYVFIELILGISFLINYNPLVTNLIALIVMSVSLIGVVQSLMNKKHIQCACLGAVFNLPMSSVTLVEDGLMIVMSGWMLIFM